VVPTIVLYIFNKYGITTKFEVKLLFLASILHIMADIPFSYFHLYYPVYKPGIGIPPGANTFWGMIPEILLGIVFIWIFLKSNEDDVLANFLSKNLNAGRNDIKSRTMFFYGRYLYTFMFIAFNLFAVAQFIFYFRLIFILRGWFDLHLIIFFWVFTAFITCLGIVFIKLILKTHHEYQQKTSSV